MGRWPFSGSDGAGDDCAGIAPPGRLLLPASEIQLPTRLNIDLRSVSGGYDAVDVIRDVSLRIPHGQFVGLVGPSGAGKTSLLKAILGGLPRIAGTVLVDGMPVTPGNPPSGVGYVPQIETVDWSFPVTVENVVTMGRIRRMGPLPWPSREDRRATEAILEQLGLGGLGRRQIRDLSGGQQQRVFLARALIGQPGLLILDEPTAGIDVKSRDDILHLLATLNRQGVTIVISTHELNAVAAHLPWVVCVSGGVVAQGSPLEVFTPPILSRTFGTEMRVVRDQESGGLLIAEAGRHGPFAEPHFHHEHLHAKGIPHEHAGLGFDPGDRSRDHQRMHEEKPAIAGVAD
jgi:zinc/manganese transport system ATP-binding protein/zinc transport system ATP-binding protein